MRLFLLSIILIFPFSNLLSQSEYNVGFSFINTIWGEGEISIEKKMTNTIGVRLTGAYAAKSITLFGGVGGKYQRYKAAIDVRKYFGKKNNQLSKAYCFVGASHHNISVDAIVQNKDYEMIKGKRFTPYIGLGWRFPPLKKHIPNAFVDLYLGAGYRFGETATQFAANSRNVILADNGISPVIGFQVGYRFGNSENRTAIEELKVRANPSKYQREIEWMKEHYSPMKIKIFERRLKNYGLAVGVIDGICTDETITAIMKFQKMVDLKPDGLIGSETLKKLNF